MSLAADLWAGQNWQRQARAAGGLHDSLNRQHDRFTCLPAGRVSSSAECHGCAANNTGAS